MFNNSFNFFSNSSNATSTVSYLSPEGGFILMSMAIGISISFTVCCVLYCRFLSEKDINILTSSFREKLAGEDEYSVSEYISLSDLN